jgi:hypothetical protein
MTILTGDHMDIFSQMSLSNEGTITACNDKDDGMIFSLSIMVSTMINYIGSTGKFYITHVCLPYND